MEKLSNFELHQITGGSLWSDYCTGFSLGASMLALMAIPLSSAVVTSVGFGCGVAYVFGL